MKLQILLAGTILLIIGPFASFCAIDQTSTNPHQNHFYQHLEHYIAGGSEGHSGHNALISEPGGPSGKDPDANVPSTNPYRTLKHFPYATLYEPGPSSRHEPEVRFGWRLTIKPAPVNNARLVVKRIDESLNLTCTLEYVGRTNVSQEEGAKANKSDKLPEDKIQPHPIPDELQEPELGEDQVFRLMWHIPIMPQNSKNRVSFQDYHNSKHLIVEHLKESDGGEYECTANALVDSVGLVPPFVESIQILVKPKKGSCNEPLVLCSSGECIAKRFMCDGKPDCKNRDDESFESCGTYHPCEGKLRCSDGRCISPYWCCDRTIDKNCSSLVQSPCCAQLKHIPFLLETHYGPQPQHYNEMGFLQTTIYTIIGCSMAFMFIITIMVIAICRVHLRRNSALLSHSHHAPLGMRSLGGGGAGPGPFGDILFNSGGLPYTSTANGLLVTYNINNGVQFMGRPMNPPPYSEQPSLPPREGPPPPYTSVENLNLAVGGSSTSGLPGYSGNPDGISSTEMPGSSRSVRPTSPARDNATALRRDNEDIDATQPLLGHGTVAPGNNCGEDINPSPSGQGIA